MTLCFVPYGESFQAGTFPLMTTISKGNKLVTLINVFTGTPDHQQEVVDLLTRATETSVRHAPGFISSSLHRSVGIRRRFRICSKRLHWPHSNPECTKSWRPFRPVTEHGPLPER